MSNNLCLAIWIRFSKNAGWRSCETCREALATFLYVHMFQLLGEHFYVIFLLVFLEVNY